jgi:hypothetical protein
VSKLFAEQIVPVAKDVYLESDRNEARKFLQRLFNQNEQALGLFYLHPDIDCGISESSVVFLRVAIALRSEHYEVLMSARRGRLDPAFRAKLGWLKGNLYSRAATQDWGDAAGGKKEFDKLVKDFLTSKISGRGPIWLSPPALNAAVDAGVNLNNLPLSAVKAAVDAYAPTPTLDQLRSRVVEIVSEEVQLTNDELRKVGGRVANDPTIRALLKSN